MTDDLVAGLFDGFHRVKSVQPKPHPVCGHTRLMIGECSTCEERLNVAFEKLFGEPFFTEDEAA